MQLHASVRVVSRDLRRVLIATGEWERAERELLRSLRTFDSFGGIGSRIHALARLAELRLRQGRIEEAERLLEDCQEQPLALVQVARLRLLRGSAAAAAAIVERRLAALPEEVPARAALLFVLVDAHIAQDQLDVAAAAARRLHRLADGLRRDNLRGLAHLASAEVALAAGGNAIAETRQALARFEQLGAARKADEAAALLRSLGAEGRTVRRNGGDLTSREREVLALLGEGLSNAEIATRLVISQKTAGHHVSRIFRKLGLRNRGEAVAYALRQKIREASIR
jgi:DNA-binding CsgD family transcriptional regulator